MLAIMGIAAMLRCLGKPMVVLLRGGRSKRSKDLDLDATLLLRWAAWLPIRFAARSSIFRARSLLVVRFSGEIVTDQCFFWRFSTIYESLLLIMREKCFLWRFQVSPSEESIFLGQLVGSCIAWEQFKTQLGFFSDAVPPLSFHSKIWFNHSFVF